MDNEKHKEYSQHAKASTIDDRIPVAIRAPIFKQKTFVIIMKWLMILDDMFKMKMFRNCQWMFISYNSISNGVRETDK